MTGFLTKKNKHKRGFKYSDMSGHEDYLHASLQLFHLAVRRDMQNMNPGGER